MIYKATVKHYEEWDDKEITSFMFVCADSIVQAVQQISDYYGENCLEDIMLTPFSPDNFLIINDCDNGDLLFHDFALRANESVCW